MKLGIIFILILTYFLFASGPVNYDSSLYRSLWESGHFILFAAIVFVLLKIRIIKDKPWYILALAIAPFCIFVGLITEVLQLLVGRSFQYSDIINDVIGGYAGFLLSRFILTFSPGAITPLSKKRLFFTRIGFVIGIILLTLAGFRAFVFTSIHVWNMNDSFPVLADFEAPFELDRWEHSHSTISTSSEVVPSDEHSLKVTFYPAKYPGIVLRRLVNNWGGYNYLNFSINNPSNQAINIYLKIHDNEHIFRQFQYNDRFNEKLVLIPGWNDIRLPLKEIKNSPKNRKMNMRQIYLINFFMIKLEEETTIYFDDVFLSN